MTNLVLNNVLCYISSGRDTVNTTDIISISHAFYEAAAICEAKDLIYGLVNEKVVRRVGNGKIERELQDILEAFNTAEQKSVALPKFVAHGLTALPPTSGFEVIADMINALRSEMSSTNAKISTIEARNDKTSNILKEIEIIKKQVSDLNKKVHNVPMTGPPIRSSNGPPKGRPNSQNRAYSDAARAQSQRASTTRRSESANVQTAADQQTSVHNASDAVSNPQLLTMTNGRYRINVDGQTEDTSDVSDEANGQWRHIDRRGSRMARLRQRNQERPHVKGTRKNCTLAGYDRNYDIFIRGIKPQFTKDDLVTYCEGELNLKIIECDDIVTQNKDYKCFKIKLSKSDRDKCLENPDYWPEEVTVRKFYTQRNNRNVSRN